jgi:hypothetical protein
MKSSLTTAHSAIETLESTLNDLTTQLAALKRQQEHQEAGDTDASATGASDTAGESLNSPSHQSGHSRSVTSSASAAANNDPVFRGVVLESDALQRLESFRKSFTPNCPFVALHPAHTLETVRRDLPTTFRAILALTESRRSVQKILQEDLIQIVAQRAFSDGEASLDLLRALMILAAWQHHFISARMPKLYLLLQLCLSMVQDLGLERSIDAYEEATETAGDVGSVEKRLLLGVFWLSVL